MSVLELVRWQWGGYSKFQRSRVNLLIHIVVVPLFLAGTVELIASLVQRSVVMVVASISVMVVSLALRGRGHRQEEVPPEPFTTPVNAISRILLEQWVTFPRFVFSGGWLRGLREATKP